MRDKLKPFNPEAAKNGAKVMTRDGHPVRIICYDRKNEAYPIVALVEDEVDGVYEHVVCYSNRGEYYYDTIENENHARDLFMAPVKREGWVNLYKSYKDDIEIGNLFVYNTKDIATNLIGTDGNSEDYIATVKLEWEE